MAAAVSESSGSTPTRGRVGLRGRLAGALSVLRGQAQTVPTWDAGGSGRRRLKHWYPTNASAAALAASGDLTELRHRSHDQHRRNPLAKVAMDSWVSNLVGTGIVPIPMVDNPLRQDVLDVWRRWVDEADADGQLSFYGLQDLVARGFRESGDSFVRIRRRRARDGMEVPLQLQVLEAELCDNAKNELLSNGRRVRAGIEFDAIGRRRAYWMYPEHPGDAIFSLNSTQAVPVPARSVIHVYHPIRPGQIRGVPDIATVLMKLFDLDKYDDAEVVRKGVAALWALVITRPTPEQDPLPTTSLDTDGTEQVHVEPGSTLYLEPGEEMSVAQAAEVGGMYEAFMRMQLRLVAAGSNVMYEHFGDYSGVTFSSARMARIEFLRKLRPIQQNVLAYQLCRRVWQEFLVAAQLSGAIQLPAGVTTVPVRWAVTPGYESTDPLKDINAVVAKIRAGLMSRTAGAAELGTDIEELDKQIAAEQARERELGLIFQTNVGASAPNTSDEDDDDEQAADDRRAASSG